MKLKKFLETASTKSMRPLPHELTTYGVKNNKVTNADIIIQVFCNNSNLNNVLMQNIIISCGSFNKYLDKFLSEDLLNMEVINIDTDYTHRKHEKGKIMVGVYDKIHSEKEKED